MSPVLGKVSHCEIQMKTTKVDKVDEPVSAIGNPVESRNMFHKPSGDVGEVPSNYDSEDVQINELKDELIEIERNEYKFEKEQILKANEEVERRAKKRKQELLGRIAKQNMRLDAQHQQVFDDISFQDGDKYLYERLLCPGDTLLQFLAPTDNYDAEPPNVPSHKLASSGGKSGKD